MTMNDIDRPSADVWPQHATLVEILTLNPWRYHGMGDRLGIDWLQVQALFKLLGVRKKHHRQMLLDLHLIEQTALSLP